MEDFSLINVDINFLDGPYVHVMDEKNDLYALEFYEKIENEWGLVWSSDCWKPYHWFKHNKKFRNYWQIKIWGWEEDSPKLLVCNTYSDRGKNICLEFIHDSYQTHKKWSKLALNFSKKEDCKIYIISKFSLRLEKDFSDESIFFFPPTENLDTFLSEFNIYSKFSIGKFDIQSRTEDWWESGLIFENHVNPVKTWDHKNDWVGMSDEQIFNDIMNI